MRLTFAIILSLLCALKGHAQELFIQAEPASTIPKKTLAIRLYSENYREVHKEYRDFSALRIMYGVTPNLSIYATASGSNHHASTLPPDFPDHNTPQIGVKLPFLFGGVNLYAKYRVYSHDGENSHFRIAAFSEYGFLNVAHDEAEPNVMEDTKGYEGGLIFTYLKKHFAVSFTGGGILPATYYGVIPDPIAGLPSVPAAIKYSNALSSDLSFGYLLLPQEYKNYNQVSLSVYLEFTGMAYDTAKVYLRNFDAANGSFSGSWYRVYRPNLVVLGPGQYVEADPGIQLILKSTLRLDFSVGFPVYGRSYIHFYPLYTFGLQRYFYFKKKKG